MPKLSIIVPIYNVADYLPRCLDSVIAQDYKDFEVILVDDGSTDSSGKIADEYACRIANFRVIHKSNGGLMDAWITGVEAAEGDYIGFVDSDDWIDPDMYSSLMTPVEQYNVEISLCNHWYETESGSNEWTIHRNPISGGLYEGESLEEIKGLMYPRLGHDYISPSRWSKVMDITLLRACLKYCDKRISSAEDVNSMVPCMLFCKSFYYVDRPFYRYCKNEKSISHIYKPGILDTYVVLVGLLCSAIRDSGANLPEAEADLWNFYGVSWCLYVMGSCMNGPQKKAAVRRLYQCGRFQESLDGLRNDSGTTARLYKIALRANRPRLFLILRELMSRIKR